jgi:hypothetical protein
MLPDCLLLFEDAQKSRRDAVRECAIKAGWQGAHHFFPERRPYYLISYANWAQTPV